MFDRFYLCLMSYVLCIINIPIKKTNSHFEIERKPYVKTKLKHQVPRWETMPTDFGTSAKRRYDYPVRSESETLGFYPRTSGAHQGTTGSGSQHYFRILPKPCPQQQAYCPIPPCNARSTGIVWRHNHQQ